MGAADFGGGRFLKIQIAGGVSPKIFCSAAPVKKIGETGDLPQESAAKVLRNRAEGASLKTSVVEDDFIPRRYREFDRVSRGEEK